MKRILVTACSAAAVVVAATAYAGSKWTPNPVYASATRIVGNIPDSRTLGNNTTDYLGYRTHAFNNADPYIQISGYSQRTGILAACVSSDPRLVHLVESLNNDVNLIVDIDPSGQCTHVSAYNTSETPPKTP